MNRARLIVETLVIQKQGEVNFFDIRLPKNVKRIIGIEADVFVITPYTLPTNGGSGTPLVQQPFDDPTQPYPTGSVFEINRTPFLKWKPGVNPVIGKLKIQSLDRMGLFFETWVALLLPDGGIPDMSFGLFPKSPYTVNQNRAPKKIDYFCEYRTVQGMYEDHFGKGLNQDMNYLVKVFMWVETNETTNGVVFDFQENRAEETRSTENNSCINELQIKI